MNVQSAAVILAASGCVLWLSIKVAGIWRDIRGQVRQRRWIRYRSWFRAYQVRVLGPELFRRWRPGRLLAHGYRPPAVIRPRFDPFQRLAAYRLRRRRSGDARV